MMPDILDSRDLLCELRHPQAAASRRAATSSAIRVTERLSDARVGHIDRSVGWP